MLFLRHQLPVLKGLFDVCRAVKKPLHVFIRKSCGIKLGTILILFTSMSQHAEGVKRFVAVSRGQSGLKGHDVQ